MSPDGPSNFYQAVAAAASPSSRDRGGLIAFNDRCVFCFEALLQDHSIEVSLLAKSLFRIEF